MYISVMIAIVLLDVFLVQILHGYYQVQGTYNTFNILNLYFSKSRKVHTWEISDIWFTLCVYVHMPQGTDLRNGVLSRGDTIVGM